jgi:hypothetical protein
MKKILLTLLLFAGLVTIAPRAEARQHDRDYYRNHDRNHRYYSRSHRDYGRSYSYRRPVYGYGYRDSYYRSRGYSYYRPARYYYDDYYDYDYYAPRRYHHSRPRFSFFFGL